MTGWLIYNYTDVEKNKAYIGFYMEEGKRLQIDIELILTKDLEFGIKNNSWFLTYQKRAVKEPDFVICRAIYPLLTRHLEYMGIKVYNNSYVADICNDKAKTYQYVAQLGIPMAETIFKRNLEVKNVMETVVESSVIKAVSGHGGSQVFLYESHGSTLVENNSSDIITGLKGEDVVIQPLIGGRHQDVRVYVIGKDIIGVVLRTAKEGFKSNFSLGGKVEPYNLSEEETRLVKSIIHLFDAGMIGIDFIIGDGGELIFNEIEDVVGARMLYQCTNINLVGLYLEFIFNDIKKSKL